MNRLCVIPARGGSKRIPRKNIKLFCGKPAISYSISTAIESGLFDKVIVSTEDQEIAAIAESFGAEVPFMRSAKAADDFATTTDVLIEVLQNLANIGEQFSEVCCIYPTAVLLKSKILKAGHQKLQENETNVVFPVLEYATPIQRALKRDKEGWTVFANPYFASTRTQDLAPHYLDAGMWYWFKTTEFLKKKQLLAGKVKSIVIDETEAQDIDTLSDWTMAEIKYQILNRNEQF